MRHRDRNCAIPLLSPYVRKMTLKATCALNRDRHDCKKDIMSPEKAMVGGVKGKKTRSPLPRTPSGASYEKQNRSVTPACVINTKSASETRARRYSSLHQRSFVLFHNVGKIHRMVAFIAIYTTILTATTSAIDLSEAQKTELHVGTQMDSPMGEYF